MLIMRDVLIRCNYLGWTPLAVVLIELTNGDRYVCRYGKLAGSVCMRLKGNDAGIHQITRS
jgi:hypothetical protein